MPEDMLDIAQSSHELKITEAVRRVMTVMSGWALLMSICGFLLSVAGLVTSVLLFMETMNRSYFREDDFFAILLLFVATVAVFLISKFLLDFRVNLKRSLRQESDVLLEKAFKGLRNTLIVVTIVWVLGTGFMLFLVGLVIYFWAMWGY